MSDKDIISNMCCLNENYDEKIGLPHNMPDSPEIELIEESFGGVRRVNKYGIEY